MWSITEYFNSYYVRNLISCLSFQNSLRKIFRWHNKPISFTTNKISSTYTTRETNLFPLIFRYKHLAISVLLKSERCYRIIELNILLSRIFFKSIYCLFKLTHRTIFSLQKKVFELIHINILLQISIKKSYFHIHLVEL